MSSSGPNHLDHDACIDLVAGLIAGDRRLELLLHIARCPSCEDLLLRTAARRERARSTSQEWLAELWGEAATAAGPAPAVARPAAVPAAVAATAHPARAPSLLERWFSPRWAGRWVAATSVLTLLAVTLGPTMMRRSAARRVHWLPGSAAEVTTRDPSAALPDTRIRAGLEAYARHDLAGARRSLSVVEGRGSIELVRRVYLANTLAQQGQHREASEILERLPTDLIPEPWRSESRWTLAVSLRARGESARADSLVAALAQEPGPVGDRARRASTGR